MEPERIDRVEERIAWLERHVVAQDKAMLELADAVQRLKRELSSLRESAAARDAAGGEAASPADERPPHY